jgi:hypothetical protein
MSSEIRASQMDCGVTALERGGIGDWLRTAGMPLDFKDLRIGLRPRRSPDEENHLIPFANKTQSERLSYQSGSAAQQKLPDHQSRCWPQLCWNKLAKANENEFVTAVGCSGDLRPTVLQATWLRLFPIVRLFTSAAPHLY